MITWKWSLGKPYHRSARIVQVEETEELQENPTNMFSRSKREDIDLKISDREMLSQRGLNPFFQTSYVNDVSAQDAFLKPLNTTYPPH